MSVFLLSVVPVFFRVFLEGYVFRGEWVIDEWSVSLVFLRLWLGSLMGLFRGSSGRYCVWGVTARGVLSFRCYNFLGFYVFFELCLVPVVVMMLKWGGSPERLRAVFYLLLYTLLGSFPFLVFICYRVVEDGHVFLGFRGNMLGGVGVLGVLVVVGFLVKLPVFPFHLWLTKAHVEAPTAGSMVLAGILLKLGGLGVIRVVCRFGCLRYGLGVFLISVSLWGSIFAFFVAISQVDRKAIVAYRSVRHMALVLVGVLRGGYLGLEGSIFLMVLHGLYSSGQFSVLGDISSKAGTRCFILFKGVGMVYPGLVIWWFVLCCCSIGCPPFCRFLTEGLIGMVLGGVSFSLVVFFGVVVLLRGVCRFVLYSGVVHGGFSSVLRPGVGYDCKAGVMGLFHCFFLVFLFFFPGLVF